MKAKMTDRQMALCAAACVAVGLGIHWATVPDPSPLQEPLFDAGHRTRAGTWECGCGLDTPADHVCPPRVEPVSLHALPALVALGTPPEDTRWSWGNLLSGHWLLDDQDGRTRAITWGWRYLRTLRHH